MNIYTTAPNYEQWCEANGLNPDDDENYNAYCEWKDNN
jgi:hypothetical protein